MADVLEVMGAWLALEGDDFDQVAGVVMMLIGGSRRRRRRRLRIAAAFAMCMWRRPPHTEYIRRGPDTPVGKSVRTAISEEKDEEKEVGEEEGEEDEDDDEEEEADNSITSSITSSTGSRGGSNKRKAEQARLVGMIEKKEEEKKKKKKKKKKDDPQWQMVNMFMKDKKGGEGDGEAARLAEVLLRKDMRDEEKARREEEKERREEEKERQNQEERDMKFLLDTAKWMKENNVTEDGLPSYVKQKWDKLNKKVDD